MNKKLLPAIIACFLCLSLFGQEHYLVELEARSPDIQSLVQSYEGFPSIPFLAKDINNEEVSLMDLRGKAVILWFWNLNCQKCIDQIPDLNLLETTYKEGLRIISFSDDTREKMVEFANSNQIDFTIIPNSKTLSDGPYGGDLGYPKLFIIDEFGVVKWVIPSIEMENNFDIYKFLETLYISLNK